MEKVASRSLKYLITQRLPLRFCDTFLPSSHVTSFGKCSVPRYLLAHSSSCQKLQCFQFHTSEALYGGKLKNTKKKLRKPLHFQPKAMGVDMVEVSPVMTVQEVADAMAKDTDHVFEVLMYIPGTDKYDQPDSVIDNFEVIKEIMRKSGVKFKNKVQAKTVEKEDKDVYPRPPPRPEDLVKSPPVVTIMGHVDHGKTTLLDALRHSHVVDQEFGGITQHIGAFSVKMESGDMITFLDTPGHAAFSAMRARGALDADIVVLVVAADDGVMKQTIESIRFAREAGDPVIVAINKIDKPQADIEATKKGLLGHGIELEDFGGDVQAVPISALKGTGLHDLQEAIIALSEMLDIKADPNGPVEGAVIESRTDPGRGKLSSALIQRGTLKKGAVLVAGNAWCKVRGMFNDKGKPVSQAGPSEAVEIIGWRELPAAGDHIIQIDSEHQAKEVMKYRHDLQVQQKVAADQAAIDVKIEEHMKEYQTQRQARLEKGIRHAAKARKGQPRKKEEVETHSGPELALIVKGDVDGSVEALLDTLETYHSDKCRLHLLHYGVGPVTEHDISIAADFQGIVYGFNVPVLENAKSHAQAKRVQVKKFNVIYKLIDDIKEQLTQRIPPAIVPEKIGQASVLQTFIVKEGKKKVPVAGCRCSHGMLNKSKFFKLIRHGEVLIDGKIHHLKHHKNDVETIRKDVECGISFDDLTVQPQPGDVIECYELKEVEQQVEWDLEF